jgi:radical SAM superfamily enzyme YgiQ (UPF0313 family)
MKILLAYISGAPDRSDPYLSLLPTGLCSLQACLRAAGFEAELANFSAWSDTAVRQHLFNMQPKVIGISQWTHNRHASMTLAGLVREIVPSATIIMGGAHATFCYREVLEVGSPVDCVILGEGEETLLELIRHVAEGRAWSGIRGITCRNEMETVVTSKRAPLEDLDSLPSAVQYLEHSVGVDLQLQPEFILTSRGCPSACYFCSSPEFWGRKVRFRSPASIVDEILFVRRKFGLIYFSMRDDTFTVDRTRTIEICRLLIERRAHILWNCQSRVTALDEEMLVWMKRAGCECIQLGVESGSAATLKLLGKTITARQVEVAAQQIRRTGIGLSIFLISDIPGETEQDLLATLDLVKKIRPDDGYVSPLAYYPGTRLFEDAVRSGRLNDALFTRHDDAALYASDVTGRAAGRLLRQLARHLHPGSADSFQRQKELLGYCCATNVLAGEWYRQSGNVTAAEREFREITEQEADNPWGWYLLAEMYQEAGDFRTAKEYYRIVCDLVPEHRQSQDALDKLGAKKKRGH